MEEKIYNILKKHKLPLKKRETLIVDLLDLFAISGSLTPEEKKDATLKMRHELNYIGARILEIETERTYLENESRKMEKSKLRYDMTERIEKLNIEIELLENIMNCIMQHEFS